MLCFDILVSNYLNLKLVKTCKTSKILRLKFELIVQLVELFTGS